MALKKTLRLVFANQTGNTVSINVPDPKDGLTGAQAKTLMDTIVAKNIFDSTGGNLVTVKAAAITVSQTDDLALA
jgi:hypothetical protein